MSTEPSNYARLPEPVVVDVVYRNHRGETRARTLKVLGIYFGSTQWHPKSQMLVRATEVTGTSGKIQVKDFAMSGFIAWGADEVQDWKYSTVGSMGKPVVGAYVLPKDRELELVASDGDHVVKLRMSPSDGLMFADATKASARATMSGQTGLYGWRSDRT